MVLQELKEKIEQINSSLKDQYFGTISVSNCIDFLCKPFDREALAAKCSAKDANNPNGKYYNMSKDAILEAWEFTANESRRYGKLSDDYICYKIEDKGNLNIDEWKLNNSYEYDERLKNNCDGFDDFFKYINSFGYDFVGREIKMYISSKSQKLANGRLDALMYNSNSNSFLIIDWKTNDKISHSNSWEKLLGPGFKYEASDLNKYSIQVYMYKKALIETYGIQDKIDVRIIQLGQIGELGYHFIVHQPVMPYDSELLDKIIEFGYQKKELEMKKQIN